MRSVGRYVDDEPEFYQPDVWRGRAENVKQGSSGTVKLPADLVGNMAKSAKEDYQYLLDIGICPEQARMVLANSQLTEWIWSGSLDAFASMCVLRLKGDTQYETRVVAQQIDTVMSGLFPVSWKALVQKS